MASKDIESKIKNYEHDYVDSLNERQDIKDVYVKCKGNIPQILKHIISANSPKSKKRITDIIHKMINNGEVVKFSEMQTTEKRTIYHETPKTSRLNSNMSTSSKIIEHPNIQNISIFDSSTLLNNSRDNFSCGPHLGIQDILQIYPGFMNDSRTTASTNNDTIIAPNATETNIYPYGKCGTPNKRKYTKYDAQNPKKSKMNDNSIISQGVREDNMKTPTVFSNKQLNYNDAGFKVSQPTKNENVRDVGLNTTNKIENIHKQVHTRKQNIRKDKPGPSQNLEKKTISSPDLEIRLIPNKLDTANLNQSNNEMCVTNNVIDLESMYAAETVMDAAYSRIKRSTLNCHINPSTSHTNPEKTTIAKEQNQFTKLQILHDVKLTPLKSKGNSNSRMKGNSFKKKTITQNGRLMNQKLKNDTTSSTNETELPIDLSRKIQFQETGRKTLPTFSKVVTKSMTVSNSTENNKALPINNPATSKTTTVEQIGINRIKLVDQNLAKPGTSQAHNKSYSDPKTSTKENSFSNIPLNVHTTMDIEKTCGKMTNVCKSVCFKEKLLLENTFKAKKEKMNHTEKCLPLIRRLFSKHLKNLPDTEKNVITKFYDADNKYQCICLELITSRQIWYNIFNFSQNVRPDMEHSDILEMVTAFKENRIIDTDYQDEHEVVLLNQLSKYNLIKICDDLEKEGLTIYNKNKPDEKLSKDKIIENIHKHCITPFKINLLREKIQKRMGICMKLNKNFQQVFYSIYFLATYTNPRFLKMQDYFRSILIDKVIFPKYPIDDYTTFTTWGDFISYSKAVMLAMDLKNLIHDLQEFGQACGKAFEELKVAGRRSENNNFEKVPHLIQFTAKAVYVNILTDAADILLAKYPDKVKEWLEYMIKFMKKQFPHKIGCWYHDLTLLYLKYLKPFDYGRISLLIRKVLDEERKNLSDVQLHRMYQIGRQVTQKKNGIFAMDRDCILERLPKSIAGFREKNKDPKSGMSNKDFHMGLLSAAWNADKIIASFTLFFFDIIYEPKKFIPATFISDIQSEPLDLNTPYFYSNRKVEIERRLIEIERDWSDNKVTSFIKKNYEMHSHEYTICKIGDIIKDPNILDNLINDFGRNILAKIYKRLAENFAEHRNGFPNLLIKCNEKNKYFGAIKKMKKELSIEELLWLDFLRSNGAEVVIIRTPTREYKKNIKKVAKGNLFNPSTSSQNKVS